MPPSSPFALSPPSSPRKHIPGALTSGSRAAPVPEKATRGFATVSSLVRSEHFAQQLDEDRAVVQQAPSRRGSVEGTEEFAAPVKKLAKRATKNATIADGEKPKPKPRGRKPKSDKELEHNNATLDPELRLPPTRVSPFFDNAEAQTIAGKPTEPAANAPKLTKSGKPRKPRAKKEKTDDGAIEPKPKKTRVAKPKTAAKAGKAPREAADVVSTHFPVDKDQADGNTEATRTEGDVDAQVGSIWDVPQSPRLKQKAPKQKPLDPLAEGLDLDEAISRRRHWTPPRNTVAQNPSTVSTGKENRPLAPDATTGTFTNLISNFTYESPTAKATANTTMAKGAMLGVTKRRRVELVDLPGVQTVSRASSPEKGKAPKKKPRTITDLVTGQYAPKEANADAQAVTSDFFSPRTSTIKVALNDVASGDEAPKKKAPRKRSKSKEGSEGATTKANPRVRKTSSKLAAKPKPVAEKLLSPTSAVMRMNRQEVLFGTSSQLALEESPTTVRQIQRAITESEQEIGGTLHYLKEAPPRWPRLQCIEGKRGLWRESTRDGDGGLLENADSVYIPEPDRTQDLPLLMDIALEEPSLPSGFVDIDDIEPAAPITISSDLPTPPESQSQKQLAELTPTRSAPDEAFEDIDDFDNDLPPSNQNAESQTSFADIDDFQPTPPAMVPRPLLRMSRPPASAPAQATVTDSPKKRRGRLPKAKSAMPTFPASAPPPSHKPVSPQQTSQRLPSTPLKGSGRFIDIEEILDSEDEALEAFSPTPPRVRKQQDSPPLPLAFDCKLSAPAKCQIDGPDLTPILRVLTSHLEWANIKPSVCSAITAHIRSIPPTTDLGKPSWHEKILMYDPIILEDFTAYLNSNTNLRTYKRATQKQIKAYNNEMKMKGNAILGAERDDQVLAIEKELEVYMVRDWCQEMSICCIHAKESRGRGSARKGFY